jgi:hypothetical protein
MLPHDTFLGRTPAKPHKAPRWVRALNLLVITVASWCFLAAFASALGVRW